MPTIILSYRREDTKWIVGRIFDRLERHYGTNHVFMDIDSIPFGLDFRERIQESLKRCDILVAIIGPRWASSDEHSISRLNEETDWVRIAIQTALANKIPVIPVLIDGAPLPSARELPLSIRDLAFRQAAPLDSGRDFHPHMDRLIKVMDQLLAHAKQPKAGPVSGPSARPSGAALLTERIASSGQASATTRRHVQIEAFSSLPSNEGAQTQLPLARNQSAPIQQSIGEKSVAGSASHSRNLPRWGINPIAPEKLFLSLDGRINRAKYWAGVVFLAIISIVLGFIIGAMFGSSTLGASLVTLVTIALFYPGYAVAAKRFQDRDKRGVIALLGLVPVLIASLLQAFGFTGTPQEPNAIGWACNLVSMGVGLWFLVELGGLKRTKGPNRYGPDSLHRT